MTDLLSIDTINFLAAAILLVSLLVMASNSVMSVTIRDASCDSPSDIQPPASPVFTPRLSQQSRFESFSPRWQFSDVEQRLTAVAQ